MEWCKGGARQTAHKTGGIFRETVCVIYGVEYSLLDQAAVPGGIIILERVD